MACRTAGPQPPSSMPRSASVSSSLSASRGAMGIVTSSAATELSLISRDFARARTSNTVGAARKTGSGLPNISAATDAPRVRTSSASENTSAAGARPFNAISSKTPEPEQEPRLVGIIKMLPASEAPCSGWWTSMTRLVAGSTPPQKLSASAAATTGPCATPERTLRTASKLPTVNGDFSTWLGRERHLSGLSRGKSTRTLPTLGRCGTFQRASPRHPKGSSWKGIAHD